MGVVPRSALRLALILLTAAATAAVLARAIWMRLSSELHVRTDIVGYPTFENFNIERYFQRYWLVVAFVPLVTLGLFLVLDRIVPGSRPNRSQRPRADTQHSAMPTNRSWGIVGRVGLVGAILAAEIAIVIRQEPDWIWTIGLPAMTLYGVVIASAGRWIDALPGKDAWERSAAANALAAPFMIVGLLAVAARTSVVGPDRAWSFDWLPGWLALVLALIALGWIAAQMYRRVPPTVIDRSVALAISGPLAIFLSVSWLPGALGHMDMFHEGESLAAAELVRDGAFPWRDLIFIHGLLVDVLTPLIGMTVFDDSRWGVRAGGAVLLIPFYWIVIYAFCAYLFRSNWLFLLTSQIAVFASVAGIEASKFDFLFGAELRFLLLPLVLITLIALLRRATAARAALFAGTTLIQAILSPEAAIAGVIFFLAVVAYEAVGSQRRLPLRQRFRRTGMTIVFGLAQLAVWCAFLAWHGALDEFFNVYLTFSSSHELTGGLPLQPTGTNAYWLAMYVPPAAALVMLGLIAALAIRRQRVSAADWGLAAMALFVLVYFHKFVTRPDAAHAFQVAAVGLPLVLYVVFRLVEGIDNLLARIEIPKLNFRIPRAATIAALVLVAAINAAVIGRTLESQPTRLHATTHGAPELRAVGFAAPGAVDLTLVRDLGELARFYLKPGDTVFDFSNAPALFHYILELKPGTRYYHVSMAIRRKTQLDLIEELEHSRPKLVFYTGSVGLPSWDGVSNSIRHYDVSEWILRRYRPVAASHGFLVMVPKSSPSPPLTGLRPRLVEPPTTDFLHSLSPPCNWGYAPTFLTPEPESDRTALTLRPENVEALTVRGWAVDPYARKPARLALVALGERIVGWATPQFSRPDIEQSLGSETFKQSGFQVEVPWNRLARPNGDRDLSSLRVYGLLQDGRALELGYGAFAGLHPSSPLPAELTLGGWRIPVASEAPQGAVDDSAAGVVSVRVPSLASYGWLEIESARPLAANDFVVNAEDRPRDPVTFSTLGRGERRVRVRVGACSQWYGYRGKRLLIRSRVDPNITSIRLYR
jgi:hypothetical protein